MAKHSTRRQKPKPAGVSQDFPLWIHKGAGQWCKKVRGVFHYFGPADDPDAALKRWLTERDYLLAGVAPPTGPGLTIESLCFQFLADKEGQLNAGKMTQRSFNEYRTDLKMMAEHFGRHRLVMTLKPLDFNKLADVVAQGRGAIRQGNVIQRIRSLFKWADENDVIDRPMKFGSRFRKPTKDEVEREANKRPMRYLKPEEVRQLVDHTAGTLRACVLLGINCGFGSTDCSELPKSAVDLDGGFIHFPRPKTGVDRRCALWPETVEAIRSTMQPDGDLVFLTPTKLKLVRMQASGESENKHTVIDYLSHRFGDTTRQLGIHRKGVGFYALRHSARTAADSCGDPMAVDRMMGHRTPGVGERYNKWLRDEVENRRLRTVADSIRQWVGW